MKWLYRIVARLAGCRHRWVKRDAHNILYDGEQRGLMYVMQCKRCGWLKEKRVGV